MVSKKKFLGHLRTTTSLTALAFVLGAFPAHTASADCKDGDRTNDNHTCTVNDTDVTHVHVVTYSDEDHNPNHSDSGETGDYTLNVDVPLSTDGHDHTVLLQQNGGQGDDGGDPGADGDDVTLNLDASVSQGPHDDDDPQYGALVSSIGGPGEAGESDKADHTQGGDGGDGGTVTINSGTAGFVSVTGDADDGLIGVAGWSQGGPGLDQADRGKLLVDETGGDGGDGGSVVIALDGNVEVTSTGEGRAIGVAGLSSGADGGNDSGGGGAAGNINIRTEAVTVQVTASGSDDFGDDSFSNDFGKGDDFSQGEFGDSFDLPEDLVKGVTGVHALSWGHDGDSSADSDPGGKGGATGQAYIHNHGPVSVTLDTDGPMEELALSAGLFALSKAGDGGNASDDAGNVLSDGTKGAQAGTAVVHVHGSVSTGSSSAGTGRYARIMGIYASSQGGDGGEGYDQGEGGDGGDGDTINVYTYPDGTISTQGDEAEGIFALSLGGKGGFQDPGFSVIGINTDAGEGGKGGDVLVKLGAPETTGGAIGGGRISTQGDFSTGVKAQSIGGPGGDADGGVAMFGSSNGDGGKGGPGGNVNVQSNSVIDTTGLRAIGILAESLGSAGGATDTGFTGTFVISGEGGAGAKGGDVSVTQSADLTTSGTASPGIAAHSVGGGGGAAGTTLGGIVAVGGQGGAGADAGDVSVALTGVSAVDENDGAGRLVDTQPVVTTHGDYSYGLAAQSIGGGGGDGGDVLALGSVIPAVGIGGDGGGAGDGKSVQITLGDTGASLPGVRTYGDNAHAALGQSIGGGGGTGGDVRAAGISLTNFGMAGAADSGGDGGSVSYSSRLADIQTTGGHANGVALRSVGGGGGSGGNASTLSASLFFGSALAIGGKGGDGGDGGIVSATVSGGEIETGTINNSLVTDAHGLLAQSIGGGGGAGGSSMSRTFVLQFPTGPELPPIPGVAMSFAVGGSGGDGGDGGDTNVSLLDGGAISTIGDTSHGVFAQSIGGGGGIGGSGTAAGTVLKVPGSLLSATIDVAVGGTGGNGGDGGNVGVTLDGDISTQGAFANGVYVQSIGGGGGDASTGTADSLLFKGDIVDGVRTATQTLLKVPQYVFSNDQQAIDAAQSVTDDVIDGVVAAGGKVSSGEKLTTARSTIRLPLEVTMEAQLGGTGGDGGHGGDVTLDLNNRSTIATAGDGAKGVLAQTIGGGGGVSQGATVGLGFGDFSDDSTLQSWLAQKFVIELGRTGAGAADGGNVTADIATPITTYGSGADGVLVQSIGGGGGVGGSVDGRSNSESGRFNPMSDPLTSGDSLIDTSVALGGRGGAGGDGGDFNDVRLAGDIRTGGDHARGVILQSIGGGGGLGGSGSSQDTFWLLRQFMTIGGTGGAGGNGGALDVTFDDSDVQTAGFGSHGVLLQSIGAGGGIGGGGGRDSCEQVALGGGRRSDLATDKSEADPDAYASQAAACAVLSQNSSRTGSETGAQGASGDGGAIIANDGGQLTVTTSGDHAHGLVAQSVGGGGGLGASGATNLSSDPDGTKTSRNSFLQVGGFAPTGSDTVSGDGGTVDLSAAFSAQTLGDGSVGLLAQSIGGGGGLYDVDGVSRLNLGGVGATGEGGTVQVSTEAGSGFSTIGVGSHGVLAQSVGGGGGVVIGQLARNALNGSAPITLDVGGSGDATGNGGDVSVTHGEASVDVSIRTANELARGLIAQSVGGGGGLFTSLYAGSDGPKVDTPLRVGGDSAGHGGEVSLRLTGNARTSGIGADAIVAQSVGGGGGIGDIADKDVGVNEVDITVGGSGGQTGDGSSVQVIFDGSNGGPIIQTQLNQSNTHAYGLLAQSVGGGGGLATDISFASEGSLKVGATGGSGGRGGSVNVSGSIGLLQNTGEDSHGIVAQSIGGGGGVGRLAAGDFSSAAGVDLTLGGEPTGSASAGNVSISVGVAPNPSSIIKTQGDRSIGVLAQSIAGGGGIASTGTPQDKIRITTGGVSIGNTAGTVSVSLRDFGAADGIATFGAGSHGIVAQSIGGGGGLAGSSVLSSQNMAGAIDTSGLTGRNSIGNGGAVSVDVESSVQTSGSNAYGIIAQSIGGGGGIFGVDGGVAGRNPAGSGRSSTVAVTLSQTGEIRANGASGVGILAQSLGDDSGDQGAVTIDLDGVLTATDYGVLINGGNSGNRITVGATGSLTSSTGKAVGVFDEGGGTLTLDNSGYISGNVEADRLQTASAARPASTASFSTASLSTASFAAVPASRIAVAPAAPAVTIVNREGGVLTGASRYDAHLTNHGLLEVGGTGSVAIAGDFTQSGTGETALGELVAGASGSRLQIGGDARLSGKLSVSHANPAKGDVLQALEIGGTATGQFETVRFGVLEYSQKVENGVLSLTAERTSFGAPGAALTSQQAAIGHHLDAAFAAGNGASTLTTQAIQISANAAAPQARLANFLTQLSPDAIMAPVALSVSRTADQFDALIGCGNRAHAAPDGDGCVKFDVSGGTFDQAATDGAVGFDADIYAVSAGMQAQVNEDTSIGFTLGYESYDTSGETGRSSAETDAAVLGVSVTKQIGALELSFAGLGGYGWTDSSRVINVAGNSETASADYQSWTVAARGRAAFDLDMGGVTVTPAMDLDLIYAGHDGFSEQTGGAAGLTVEDGSQTVFRATPSVTLVGDFEIGGGVVVEPRASVGVSLASSDSYSFDAALSAAAPGAGTFGNHVAMPNVAARAALGLAVELGGGAVIDLGYDGVFSSDTSASALSARLNWPF